MLGARNRLNIRSLGSAPDFGSAAIVGFQHEVVSEREAREITANHRETDVAVFHLTARVAWHDAGWNGSVCRAPSCNTFCTSLDRIREERNDASEDALAGQRWSALASEQLPPCKAESGAFMNHDCGFR